MQAVNGWKTTCCRARRMKTDFFRHWTEPRAAAQSAGGQARAPVSYSILITGRTLISGVALMAGFMSRLLMLA